MLKSDCLDRHRLTIHTLHSGRITSFKRTFFLGICAMRRCPFQRKAQSGKLLFKWPRTKVFRLGAARCLRVEGHSGRAEGWEKKRERLCRSPKEEQVLPLETRRDFSSLRFSVSNVFCGAGCTKAGRLCRFRRKAERRAASCSFAFSPKWKRSGKTPFAGKTLLWGMVRREVSFLMHRHPRKARRV